MGEYYDKEVSQTPIRRGVKCGIDNPAFSSDDIGWDELGAWLPSDEAWSPANGEESPPTDQWEEGVRRGEEPRVCREEEPRAQTFPDWMKLKLCFVEKTERTQWGFKIEVGELGVGVSHVTPGGRAERAGLRVGDVIIRVNDSPLPRDVTRDHVWAKIKSPPPSCSSSPVGVAMLLTDPASSTRWRREGGGASPGLLPLHRLLPRHRLLPLIGALPRPPHLARLHRHPIRGYGFYLRELRGVEGQFIHDVEAGGSAAASGLRGGARVVCVNGEAVEGHTHRTVVRHIRQHPHNVALLTADTRTQDVYAMAGIPPSLYLRYLETQNSDFNSAVSA